MTDNDTKLWRVNYYVWQNSSKVLDCVIIYSTEEKAKAAVNDYNHFYSDAYAETVQVVIWE